MIDDLKKEYRIQTDDDIVAISKSLMPIGSALLRRLSKQQIMIIVLEREKAFYTLREDYLSALKNNFKDSFDMGRINLGLTYTQEQLIDKNIFMAKKLVNLSHENSLLKGNVFRLQRQIEEMRDIT